MKSAATKLQDRTIKGARKSIANGHDVFIEGPTGVGKTRKFSVIAEEEVAKGKNVIIFAARKSLVKQNGDAFDQWSSKKVETTRGMAGQIDQSGSVVYSTIQTAHDRRNELISYDVAIFDEGHHAREDNPEYAQTMDALVKANPNIVFVAVSATPPPEYDGIHPRLKNADRHVITYAEAIEAKLIDLPETITPLMHLEENQSVEAVVDRHRKAKTGVDLESGISKELGRLRGDDWAHQLVNVYERHLEDRKVLGFFDSIKEATAFMTEAQGRGHQADIIHSRMTTKQNEQAVADFRSGRSKLLVSVDMIGEGLDVDADGVLLDKKTTSRQQYQQIVGRESRSHGVNKAVKSKLVDTGASTHIHGEISALAQIQNVRGGIDRNTVTPESLLPDAGKAKFNHWVEKKRPDQKESVWGTSMDGKIVYAVPTATGYVAFLSSRAKTGAKIDLLEIDGQRKGRPTREAMGKWVSDAMRRNEYDLGRLTGRISSGVTELARMIDEDWSRNAGSIEKSIGMLTSQMPAVAAQRQGYVR